MNSTMNFWFLSFEVLAPKKDRGVTSCLVELAYSLALPILQQFPYDPQRHHVDHAIHLQTPQEPTRLYHSTLNLCQDYHGDALSPTGAYRRLPLQL